MNPHRHAWTLIALMLAVLLSACSKSNDVTANQTLDCGDDAIKCIPCDAGEVDCDGASLVVCNDDGVGFALRAECESPQLCAEGLVVGACAEPLCVAGEALCVGPVMQICAAGRHRYDLLACATDDACLRGLADQRCASVECSQASDCTGEDTQCRRRACVEGRCEIANLPSDTACTIGDVNGVCDGDGACRASDECTTAADCAGEDTECRIRVCVEGACGFADIPEGTACETTSVTGECNGEGACLPTVDCSIAGDCPGEDTQCRIRACVSGSCGFASLPQGTPCETNGLGGACDGEGLCEQTAACAVATDCPGVDTECQSRACIDGACGFDYASDGAACTVGGFGGACDGAGVCNRTAQCNSPADCPPSSNPCQEPTCSANGSCGRRSVSGSCQIGQSTGECSGGDCTCPVIDRQQTRFCGDRCVFTATDTDHCGGCNRTCRDDQVCTGSACRCPEDHRECNGICVDIRISGNCGRCGDVCPAGAQCLQGCGGNGGYACECAGGYERCGTLATDGQQNTCVLTSSSEWEEYNCNEGYSDCVPAL